MKPSLTRSDMTLGREEDYRGLLFSSQIESFMMRYWCEYYLQPLERKWNEETCKENE